MSLTILLVVWKFVSSPYTKLKVAVVLALFASRTKPVDPITSLNNPRWMSDAFCARIPSFATVELLTSRLALLILRESPQLMWGCYVLSIIVLRMSSHVSTSISAFRTSSMRNNVSRPHLISKQAALEHFIARLLTILLVIENWEICFSRLDKVMTPVLGIIHCLIGGRPS